MEEITKEAYAERMNSVVQNATNNVTLPNKTFKQNAN
jgi:hypothetical protein